MATEEEYRQARDNAVGKFKEAWDACLEFSILHGLPNDRPNYDLEVKRVYNEIETLEETVEGLRETLATREQEIQQHLTTIAARDTQIEELKHSIELLMTKEPEIDTTPEPKNLFQAWWYQSRLYEAIQTLKNW